MSNWKLKNNLTDAVIEFDQDMQWVDEFDWSKVAQTAPVYTLTGAQDIQQGIKKAGRPITLSGEWVWHQRGDLQTLRDWTDTPELTMTLTHYDGRQFSVMWRLHEKAMSVKPVIYQTPETDGDPYTAALNFIEVKTN